MEGTYAHSKWLELGTMNVPCCRISKPDDFVRIPCCANSGGHDVLCNHTQEIGTVLRTTALFLPRLADTIGSISYCTPILVLILSCRFTNSSDIRGAGVWSQALFSYGVSWEGRCFTSYQHLWISDLVYKTVKRKKHQSSEPIAISSSFRQEQSYQTHVSPTRCITITSNLKKLP